MATTDSSRAKPEQRPRPACFPLGGEVCHCFTYEGDKPQAGQVCVCGKARLGDIDTMADLSYTT